MRKLGKKAARKDPRTFKLANYIDRPSLPPIPQNTKWRQRVTEFPLYANDRIGCCGIVSPAHVLISWTHNDGYPYVPADSQVLAEYQTVGGWNPLYPSTDNGCVMLDVMNRWRSPGLFGRPIGAYAAVDPDDTELVQAAIYLFGGLVAGYNLPKAVEGANEWRTPNRRARRWGDWRPGSWGGHAIALVDYDENQLTGMSWGQPMPVSYGFHEEYCDELYCALSVDWLGPDGKAPNGFDGAALARDIVGLGA